MAPRVVFERPDLTLEESYRIPGGTVVVQFTRLTRQRLPLGFIVSEPDDASVARTRIRDQVALLNDLYRWGNNRLLDVLIDADAELRPVLLVAKSVMEAP